MSDFDSTCEALKGDTPADSVHKTARVNVDDVLNRIREAVGDAEPDIINLPDSTEAGQAVLHFGLSSQEPTNN